MNQVLDYLINQFGLKSSQEINLSLYKKSYGNDLYLFQVEHANFLLRINNYAPKDLRRTKENEHKCLWLISDLGIGPNSYYLDISKKYFDHDLIIVDFIEGETLADLNDFNITDLAVNLHKLHSIKSKLWGDNLLNLTDEYYRCKIFDEFATGDDKNIYNYTNPGIELVQNRLELIKTDLGNWFNNLTIFELISEYCLCHADLKKENIIQNSKGIYLIDWEYARFDIFHTDIARLFSFCGFTNKQQELFMQIYDSQINKLDYDRINVIKIVLDFFKIMEDYLIHNRKKWDINAFVKELDNFETQFNEIKNRFK